MNDTASSFLESLGVDPNAQAEPKVSTNVFYALERNHIVDYILGTGVSLQKYGCDNIFVLKNGRYKIIQITDIEHPDYEKTWQFRPILSIVTEIIKWVQG